MKVTRSGGLVRMRLEQIELDVLGNAFDDLLTALDDMGPGDDVWERLYPAAFEDADAAEEFREMVGEELDSARRERLSACRGELSAAPHRRRGTELSFEPEALERWIMALNDLRLSLGTTLRIGPDEDGRIDPQDPAAASRALYHWLTGIQDGLVSQTLG